MANNQKVRNLDGVFFRVERDGKFQNICFSDLTQEEIESLTSDRDKDWWKTLALHLKDCLNEIGEQFDIEMVDDE